jgi:predicted TIM-barrel fold metal-dependent hydrolase
MDKIAELKIPILFDSGLSTAPRPLWYYDPFTIDSIANEYPEAPIIIGHTGKTERYFFEAALMVSHRKENVYVELSYQTPRNIEKAVTFLGAHKCMFGTDWPRYLLSPSVDFIENQLQAIKNAKISDEEREQIMGKTILKILGF